MRADLGPDAVGHLPMDGFHLADVQLDRLGSIDHKGAPDTIDDDVRRARLVRRHEQFGKSPDAALAWVERSDEANAALVASTRDAADVVVALSSVVD
ncbi:MAG: hypothetical protein LH477_16265 [Nocardioides sp.]|nr:hypothetical protein [Nocardioides sp.]